MSEPLSVLAGTTAAEGSKVVVKEAIKETAESTIKESVVKESLSTIENTSLEALKTQNEAALRSRFDELAPKNPLYENNPSRLSWINRFDKVLNGVDGYESVKMKTLSANIDSARGNFAEIVRAYRLVNAGYEVKAIGKNVITNLGKTDIDVLAYKDGKSYWVENKDVSSRMPLSKENALKLEKISDGLKNGVTDFHGNEIKIDKAVFVNKGEIGSSLIEKARSLDIHIKEKMDARDFQRYMQNLSA